MLVENIWYNVKPCYNFGPTLSSFFIISKNQNAAEMYLISSG